MPAMTRPDRHRRRRRRRSAATWRGWSARRPGCASSGCSAALRGATGARRRRAAGRWRPGHRPRLRAGRRPAGEEPGADLRVPAARAATSSRPRSARDADRADDAATAHPRRRLHRPRRGDGRARGAPTPNDAWRSPGSMPTATSTRPTRRRRATSGGCPSRCCADAATPTSSPPPTARRVDEAHAALLGGQVLDEAESRMLAASSDRPFRGRDARDAGRASPRWPAGPRRSRREVDGSTSRSTWIASTRPAAGR